MKLQTLIPAMAALLALSAMASRADTLLLNDNFDVSTPVSGTDEATALEAANNNLAARQSGLYAGTSYILASPSGTNYKVRTGDSSLTYYHGASTPTTTDGNNLALNTQSNSGGNGVQLDLPINLALAGNHALTISFDLYLPNTTANTGAWEGISLSTALGATNAAAPLNATSLFGFRTKVSGASVQLSNASSTTPYLNNTGNYTATAYTTTWTIVLSDVVGGEAGTGSAFAGNGTYVSIYNGDNLIDGRELDTDFGDNTLYLGFWAAGGGDYNAAFDNLSITAVPEPASVGYLVAAGLGFVILAARRRRVVRG